MRKVTICRSKEVNITEKKKLRRKEEECKKVEERGKKNIVEKKTE